MTRTKIEKRKIFSKEEKEFIKLKTGCRCGHCGCKLTEENMTVDHIIPLSKGGTNNEKNLICLCKECNLDKSDMLADPLYYYPYLKEDYLEDIAEFFKYYIENVSYEHRTNLMCIDILGTYMSSEEKKYFIKSQLGKSGVIVEGINKSLELRYFISTLSNIQLRKAVYSDLDEIYDLLIKRLGYSKKDAYDKVDAAFISYSIYVYKLKGNIIGFFFLVPRRISADRDIMILSIEELYLKYKKYKSEIMCLLSGFCSFFLSKRSFSNEYISVQSRDDSLVGSLGRLVGKNLSIIKRGTTNNFSTVFLTKGNHSFTSFLCYDQTEYQDWLHTMYSSKQDRLLNPILKSSKTLKECTIKYGFVAVPLKEPESYLGKTVVI